MVLGKTLGDVSNGPDWIGWIAFGIFVIIAIIMLSGHGAFMIAGYNTASKEKKAQYDKKKLCRITGCGMLAIALITFVMMYWQDVLPASFAYVFGGVVVADVIAMIVLMNTVGKKK